MIAFGSIEAKRKGGLMSQQRRRENPEFYRSLGCNVAKRFNRPDLASDLAEFVGLTLGDGGITEYQIHITLNSIKDSDYAIYVANLIERLFLVKPKTVFRKDSKAVVLILSGVEIIRWLKTVGLDSRNKVREQVCVPNWICNDLGLSKRCLRGLIDTDGGVFTHTYKINNKFYSYLKLNFSNMSQPLREFAYRTLYISGFNPKLAGQKHVWLYSDDETRNYLCTIGSSNRRLLTKIKI